MTLGSAGFGAKRPRVPVCLLRGAENDGIGFREVLWGLNAAVPFKCVLRLRPEFFTTVPGRLRYQSLPASLPFFRELSLGISESTLALSSLRGQCPLSFPRPPEVPPGLQQSQTPLTGAPPWPFPAS